MIQTQRNLMSAFFLNNDEYYIVNNYRDIVPYLTTDELKTNFLNAVEQMKQYAPEINQAGGVSR